LPKYSGDNVGGSMLSPLIFERNIMICTSCKNQIYPSERLGIHIKNYVLDNMPEEIGICKDCATQIAVNLMSGKIPNLLSLGSLLKGIIK